MSSSWLSVSAAGARMDELNGDKSVIEEMAIRIPFFRHREKFCGFSKSPGPDQVTYVQMDQQKIQKI